MGTLWMIRAGRGSEDLEDFLKKGVVAMGDPKVGPLPAKIGKDALLSLYAKAYPDMKEGTRASHVSQLHRYLTEVSVGDGVTTFDPERRVYYLGTITTAAEWAPDVVASRPCVRKVTWSKKVRRDDLTAASRNSLGAIQTIFRLSVDVVNDLEKHGQPLDAPSTPEESAPAQTSPTVPDPLESEVMVENIEKADDFIEDAINKLTWDQMQELVAGILRAMGYRARVSDAGPDRGVDIFASPDGLGLEEPRIFVEVKHRTGSAMGAQAIRAFLGGRKPGDRCLYVSTGGFTKDGRYEAERASVPITLLTLRDLRRLLVERYEELDPETAALVPLRKVYWPVG